MTSLGHNELKMLMDSTLAHYSLQVMITNYDRRVIRLVVNYGISNTIVLEIP